MDKNSSHKKAGRLHKKMLLFELLRLDPQLSVSDLRTQAEKNQISLSRSSAYRLVAEFEKDQCLEKSDMRSVRVVSEILQGLPAEGALSAKQIHSFSLQTEKMHRSTTYRVLERLRILGFVNVAARIRNETFYRWSVGDQRCVDRIACVECGAMQELAQESLQNFASALCQRSGYGFVRIEFFLKAICELCRDEIAGLN